eukprot:45781-Rhodomonas_salina.2
MPYNSAHTSIAGTEFQGSSSGTRIGSARHRWPLAAGHGHGIHTPAHAIFVPDRARHNNNKKKSKTKRCRLRSRDLRRVVDRAHDDRDFDLRLLSVLIGACSTSVQKSSQQIRIGHTRKNIADRHRYTVRGKG